MMRAGSDESLTDERVFLGLGSNLGDREANIRRALACLAELPTTSVVRISRLIETEPWGLAEQPRYINGAAELQTDLEPEELLRAVKEIERVVGRVPTTRWGPRIIDLDLLLYGAREIRLPHLKLPHPHILERAFVLDPLTEIAPEVVEELRRAAISLRGSG